MRTTYGADRVRELEGGDIVLSCRFSKQWQPRCDATLTESEFPGTAILWDDEYFEVVTCEVLPSGVRYKLIPWQEQHAIRTSERYDEASELERAQARHQSRVRDRWRRSLPLLMFLVGHLPRRVQNRIGSELGVSAAAMTVISTVPFFLLGVFSVVALGILAMTGERLIPEGLITFGIYFFLESIVRLGSAKMGRGLGSLTGVIGYTAWAVVLRRQSFVDASYDPEALVPIRKEQLMSNEEALSVDLIDAYHVREPYLGLLPAPDQQRLHSRFGFDYRKWGRRSALVILAIALVRGGVSLSMLVTGAGDFRHLFWSAVGLLLVLEQIDRLRTVAAGKPAGSVLGRFVRPVAAKLLR